MKCPSFTSAKLEGIRFRSAVPGSQQAPVWAERDSNASLISAASRGAGGCLSPLHPRRRPLRSFFPTSATAAGAGRNYLIGRILG